MPGWRAGRRQGKRAGAVRRPGEGFLGTGLAGGDLDAVGHHEGGIEADTELTDQAGSVLGLGGGEGVTEGAGAGTGDGAEIVDHLLAGHADAVVRDQQAARGLVRDDADFGVGGQTEGWVGEGFEPPPVSGVGGVGDQLAQEYFALGVKRVDHKVQQATDLGAEIVFFRRVFRWGFLWGRPGRCVHFALRCAGAICVKSVSVSMRAATSDAAWPVWGERGRCQRLP